MIATPMYGGMCSSEYMASVFDVVAHCEKRKINLGMFSTISESLVHRARNYCADAFLRSPQEYLLFIDSDIAFNAGSVFEMLDGLNTVAIERNLPYDILCAPYPKKRIDWAQVKKAVDAGLADNDPNILSKYAGDMVFSLLPGTTEASLTEPFEVKEAGTGFMMIRRAVFEGIMKKRPDLAYYPDHLDSTEWNGKRKIHHFFPAELLNDRLVSEDYYFCHLAREAGFKIHMCPWIELGHVGSYKYEGNIRQWGELLAV